MNETILVVDDEPEVRAVAREALESLGYTALDTGDPQRALRIVREQPVHLLWADVVMPVMKGTELADRVQAVSASTTMLRMGWARWAKTSELLFDRVPATLRAMLPEGSYRLQLETRCSLLLHDGSLLPCPPSWAPLQPKIRSAVRGEDCSLCGKPIPADKQVDPDPKEYLYPEGLVRLHGLHYTGAPDGTTSCLSVWQGVSEAKREKA